MINYISAHKPQMIIMGLDFEGDKLNISWIESNDGWTVTKIKTEVNSKQ